MTNLSGLNLPGPGFKPKKPIKMKSRMGGFGARGRPYPKANEPALPFHEPSRPPPPTTPS